MTASEAKQLTEKSKAELKEKIQMQLIPIFANIRKSCENGESSIYIEDLSFSLVKELRKLGYTLTSNTHQIPIWQIKW